MIWQEVILVDRFPVALSLLLSCSSLAQADKILVNRSVGSPVSIENTTTHEFQGRGIHVRNRSDQRIKTIRVEIRRRNRGRADTISTEEVPVDFAPGQGGRVRIPYVQSGDSEVTITVILVEYSDGKRWETAGPTT
jgi:hypothetical protein